MTTAARTGDWVARSSALLELLAEAIGNHVMASAAIHGDDTPVKALAPGTGKTKTGRLWVYLRDERDMVAGGFGATPSAVAIGFRCHDFPWRENASTSGWSAGDYKVYISVRTLKLRSRNSARF